jgi:hypothetical protein
LAKTASNAPAGQVVWVRAGRLADKHGKRLQRCEQDELEFQPPGLIARQPSGSAVAADKTGNLDSGLASVMI